MAQPFDLGGLQVTGDRTVVGPQIHYRRWQKAGFSVSSNGVLLDQAGSREDQQFTWFNRTGKLLGTVRPPNDYGFFSLSPNEKRVAIEGYDDPDTLLSTIWMMDLSRRGALSRVTDTGVTQAEFGVVWSPDSSEILFSRGDHRAMSLLHEPVNGGAARSVLETEGPHLSESAAPTDEALKANMQRTGF